MDQPHTQPWTRREAGAPIDRAYIDAIVDRWEKLAAEREQRLYTYLQWLSLRWGLIWAAISVLLGLLYFVVRLIAERG